MVRDDLREETREEAKLEQGEDVEALLEEIGVKKEEVLVARNGEIISKKAGLEDGDTVNVFDVIAGG